MSYPLQQIEDQVSTVCSSSGSYQTFVFPCFRQKTFQLLAALFGVRFERYPEITNRVRGSSRLATTTARVLSVLAFSQIRVPVGGDATIEECGAITFSIQATSRSGRLRTRRP